MHKLLRQQVRGGDSLNYIRTVLLPYADVYKRQDILRTQKAVERAALSDEMQKTEVDCWQEGGSLSLIHI